MHIIFDLHHLQPPFTGKANYTFNLLRTLNLFPHPVHTLHGVYKQGMQPVLSDGVMPHYLPSGIRFYPALNKLLLRFSNRICISSTSYLSTLVSPAPSVQILYDVVALQKTGFQKNLKATIIEKTTWSTALNKCSRIAAISEFTRQELVSLKPQLAFKSFTLKNPIFKPMIYDDSVLQDAALLPKKYILFIGTLEPRKNLQNLILAYQKVRFKLKDKAPDLVLAGKIGWGAGDLIKKAVTGQIPQVKYLGYVSDGQRNSLYKHSLLVAYVPLYEGFGLPPQEAISHHIPLLVSNIKPLRDLARQAALYADPQDLDSLAAQLEKLIKQPSLRRKISRLSNKIIDRYSPKRTASQFYRIIDLDQETT